MTEARDFVWFTVRDRSTGSPYSEGYWSDIGTVAVQVDSPSAGVVTRTFQGAADLISIDAVASTTTLVVQQTQMRLSQVSPRINQLIRDYDPKFGRVEVFRAELDPVTRQPTGPAECILNAIINDLEVDTPAEGGDGAVVLTLVTATQEITRRGASTRSDADQRRRSPTDNFFQDAGTAGLLDIFWGVPRA